ncbi:MAG TPA: hypothetical protein VGJ93_14500 [Desulfuromonadaceae bacterium]|jgi:hypothetical protein
MPFFSKKILAVPLWLLVPFIQFLLAGNALAKLSAEAELSYLNYDAKDNSGQHLSSHSLTQRYSLLYQTAGNILDNRFGSYQLSLGYDWATFDTTIKSTDGKESYNNNRGHILYSGEVIVDPKEIPLRFSAYSRDMNRTQFLENTSGLSSNLRNTQLISPQLATSIMSGTHIESGATLVAGVKNGMTNGYNEILRHLPMLMLDYRDSINHDTSSANPVDNRLSRLAFVSLNKKDNWFHYRILSYTDNITPSDSYKETQYQLGTIDQTMQRRWVDFSNWLTVSADAQLTQRTSTIKNIASDNYTDFDLNLFGIARRSTWEARTFNNFNRHKEESGKITYHTTVPVYASGSLSADTSWNTRFSYSDNHDNNNNQFTDYAAGYRVDTFKRASFTLSQQLDVEKTTSNNTEALIVSGALETTSTSKFSRDVALAASYNVRNYAYKGSTIANNSESNFLDQAINASAIYTPSNQIRFTLRQTNRMTKGSSHYIASTVEGSNPINSAQYLDSRNNLDVSGNTFQSITDFSVNWNPLSRLDIALSVNEDIYIPDQAARSYRTRFVNSIDYSVSNFKFSSRNEVTIDNTEPSTDTIYYNTYNRLNYTFNRNLDSYASLSYNKSTGNTDSFTSLTWQQGLNYYFYKSSGVTRKLFEIIEAAEYTESLSETINNSTTLNQKRNSTNLSLGARYYPIKQLIISAGSRYSFLTKFNDYTLTYYGSLGLEFRLFQASLDYTCSSARADGRVEKRISANVRKTF